ncbi:hypothetical protein [Dethiosulfatarculus sandiegensis]|uniref:Uncharacterized protein n=1 Tax=Dethiosulfatarculus sandiegensis TaxID=1429043 RepID=A0A0D2GHW3_9BACT|nr:hypothetical protein [Dethiosulfatarculus sandiegensis]KIX14442.1 hypothetical protein X474_09975 [Dethiosulfatarculus sandiegensis]
MPHRPHITTTCLALILTVFLALPIEGRADRQIVKQIEEHEKILDELYDALDDYRITEAELNLHHSMAQKGLQATEGLIIALKNMAVIGGRADMPLAQSALRQAKAQLKLFTGQLNGWLKFTKEVKEATSEICQRADQESDQVRTAIDQENAHRRGQETISRLRMELEQRRKSLNRAWRDLADDSDSLALQAGRLHALLQHRELFQNTYREMAKNLTKLKQAREDLDKAEKLLRKLKSLRMAFSLVKLRDIKADLFTLQDRLLEASAPETDPIWARLERAIQKTDEIYLPQDLPVLIKFDPLAQDFINYESNPNLARLRETFDRAQSIVDQAENLLPQIQEKLHEASNSQALFAGLSKARACLARLTPAGEQSTEEQDLTDQINQLRSRMEDAHRKLHLFLKWRRDVQVNQKEMDKLVNEAKRLYEAQAESAILLDESPYGPGPDSLLEGMEQSLARLETALSQLNKFGGAMDEAAQGAQDEQKKTCGQAEKATLAPQPSQDEVHVWHNQAEQGYHQVELQVEHAESGLLDAVRAAEQSLNQAQDQSRELEAATDGLLKKLKAAANMRVNLDKARELLDQAEQMWETLQKDVKGIAKQKTKGYEDTLPLLVAIGRLLDPNPQNRELSKLREGCQEVAEQYKNAKPIDPDPPMAPYPVLAAAQGLERAIARLEERAARASMALRKSKVALKQAVEQLNASQKAKTRARRALGQAQACLTSLARVMGAGPAQGQVVKQAINGCDFVSARDLINNLPAGPLRNQLENELNQALSLEQELKKLVNQAREQFKDCHPGKALKILNKALSQAKCEKHTKSINTKIKSAQKLKAYEEITFSLFKKANKLYVDGKYQKAKELLQKAAKHTSCKRIRKKLGDKIKIVKARIASETTGTPPLDQEEQTSQTSCQGYINQINDTKKVIKEQLAYYSRLREANRPREVVGPVACRIVDASKEMSDLKLAAKEAGCLQAARIKNPLGLNAAPGLVCHIYRGGNTVQQRQNPQYDAGACAALRKNMLKFQRILKKRLTIYNNYKRTMPSSPTSVDRALLQRAACSLVIGVRDYQDQWQRSKEKRCPWLNSLLLPAAYNQANLPHCPNQ